MKAKAAEGNTYAIQSIERAKVKRCSYCVQEGHTKATCDTKFKDDRTNGLIVWTGLNAAANVVAKYKLAPGAFIYGPVLHRWETSMETEPKPNYEMANYYATRVLVSEESVRNEHYSGFAYDTLTEFEKICNSKTPLPFFYEEILALDNKFEEGRRLWLYENRYTGRDSARRLYNESFNVLVEASQEEVEKTVAEILSKKPDIVDFNDRKAYQSTVRKRKLKKNYEV